MTYTYHSISYDNMTFMIFYAVANTRCLQSLHQLLPSSHLGVMILSPSLSFLVARVAHRFFPLFLELLSCAWQIFWQGHFLPFASGWCDLVTPSAGCSALTPLFLVRPQRKFTVACNKEEGPMITAESDFDFQHVLLGQDISTKAACIS